MIFTELMAVLAANPDKLIFNREMPNKWVAVIVFSSSCLVSAFFGFLADRTASNLGNFCRMQLLWSVHSATLKSTQASVSPFSTSEIVSLAGIDGMAVRWCIAVIYFIVITPIEFGVFFWLSTTQVGINPALFSMIPLVFAIIVKTLMVKVSSSHQREGREIISNRFAVLNEGIASNLVAKLVGMSSLLLDRLIALRKKEQNKMILQALSNAASMWILVSLAPFMAWLAMTVQVLVHGKVSSASIMSVLGYYNTIAGYDLYKLANALQNLALASVSANKYMNFFGAVIDDGPAETDGTVGAGKMGSTHQSASSAADARDETEDDSDILAEISDASFTFQSDAAPVLRDVTVVLPRGKLVGITGPIGEGKSSLLLALLGELHRSSGSVTLHTDWKSPVAYASQRIWLETGTVRDSLCFAGDASSSKGDVGPDWLQLVISCCGLESDIASFPEGLEHRIGESGNSLSGGQKARLALARAVYACASITVLDDPFCALDPSQTEQVFQRVLGPEGLMRGPGRSVLLVTSNPSFLSRCDFLVVVQGGTVVASCSPKELDFSDGTLGGTILADGTAIIKVAQGDTEKRNEKESFQLVSKDDYDDDEGFANDDGTETMANAPQAIREGLISGIPVRRRGVFSALVGGMGLWRLFLGGMCIVAAQATVYTWQYLIKGWLDGSQNAADFKRFAQISRLMIIPMATLSMFGALIHYLGFLSGSTKLQARCSASVLGAPYSFFSANHSARVHGHISYDSQQVEVPLALNVSSMWLQLSQLIGTSILCCLAVPFLLILFLPLAGVYYYIQRVYSKADAAIPETGTRGPINATIVTTLVGLPTIHAFKVESRLQDKMRAALIINGAFSALGTGASGWLSFISNVCIYGSISASVSILITALLKPGPESSGPIVLSNIISMSGVIGSSVVLVSKVESCGLCMQRLMMYSELPSEEEIVRNAPKDDGDKEEDLTDDQVDTEGDIVDGLGKAESAIKSAISPRPVNDTHLLVEPPKQWPATGGVEFLETYASYVWDAPPVLKGFTVSIPPGSSCAFVGRSGSGKSTAFLALCGIIPITSGAIEIDGLDVRQVTLETLREKLAVVPQEPVLFTGSLRINLDPYCRYSDAVIWDALRLVGMHAVTKATGGLDVDLVKASASPGQRQLLCLARAILRDTTVLLLDEASCSVDAETENKMALTVAQFAKGEVSVVGLPRKRTVIEVAHRLSNVLDIDQVVVLSNGRVLERGVPTELATTGGEFASMVKAQGLA